MKVRITGNGAPWGVQVIDTVSGKPLQGVVRVAFESHAASTGMATLHLDIVEWEIDAALEADITEYVMVPKATEGKKS